MARISALLIPLIAIAACSSGSTGEGDAGVSADGATVRADAASDAGVDAGAALSDASTSDGAEGDASTSDDASLDAATDASTAYVYVGSGDDNIYAFVVDPSSGTLSPQGPTAAGANPSFIAFDPAHRHLYAVNESSPTGRVAAFAIDPATGALSFLNRVSSGGSGPAHVFVEASGAWVLVANYGDGAVSVLPILAGGSLGAATDTDVPGMNAHLIVTDPANRFAFVPCLGSDYVAQLVFDATLGTLEPNAVATVASDSGAGPRHLAFHPTARWAYVINESDSTITAHDYDAASGRLTPMQTISTLPSGFSGGNSCAEIAVHPNGRFVFGSNRGHDSIAAFAIDPTNGRLTLLGHTLTGGQTPRSFGLMPDGSLLFAANQRSNTIHAFRVDATSGALEALGEVAQVDTPAFVGVVTLP